MINDTGKNVALTFEQLEQIETAKGILKNIEAETTIANKNLAILQKEVIKATKEREYQEELIESFVAKAAEKQTEYSSLSSGVAELQKLAEAAKKEADECTTKAAEVRADINSRTDAMEASEQAHKAAKDAFSKEVAQQVKDRSDIEKAREAFITAAESINW